MVSSIFVVKHTIAIGHNSISYPILMKTGVKNEMNDNTYHMYFINVRFHNYSEFTLVLLIGFGWTKLILYLGHMIFILSMSFIYKNHTGNSRS